MTFKSLLTNSVPMGRASGQIDFHVAMGIAIRVGVQFEHIKSARPGGDAPERAKMECFTQSSDNIIHDWLILSIRKGDLT